MLLQSSATRTSRTMTERLNRASLTLVVDVDVVVAQRPRTEGAQVGDFFSATPALRIRLMRSVVDSVLVRGRGRAIPMLRTYP
jgi:hypothetical protein